jgi:hypothetical protein
MLMGLPLLLALSGASDQIRPRWTATAPERVIVLAIAPDGACSAAVTSTAVLVLNRDGRPLWQAPLHDAGDFPRIATVSPTCGRAAVADRAGAVEMLGPGVASQLIALPAEPPDMSSRARSIAFSPDGALVAIGTARNHLVLAHSDGRVIQQRETCGEITEGIEVAFSHDGRQIVVKGFYCVGVMTLAGAWRWHSEITEAEIQPDRRGRLYAASFSPSHGPPGGHVSVLDAGGRTIWQRSLWVDGISLSLDGKSVAYSGQPMTGPEPQDSAPAHIWLADIFGRVTVSARIAGYLRGFSADGTCLLVHQRAANGDLVDLSGFDRQLQPAWRMADFFDGVQPQFASHANLAVRAKDDQISIYRLPACASRPALPSARRPAAARQ